MKTCAYCGAEIKDKEQRCPCCGAPVLKEERPAEQPKPQPVPTPQPKAEPKVSDAHETKREQTPKKKSRWGLIFVTACIALFAYIMISDNSHDTDAAFASYRRYMDAMNNAVAVGRFSDIDKYVEKNSSAHKYVENLVKGRHRTVASQSWRHITWSANYNKQHDRMEIAAEEKYFFKYRTGGEGYKDLFVTYYLSPTKPYRINKIIERKDPYTKWKAGTITHNNVNIRTSASLNDKDNVIGQAKRNDSVKVYPDYTKSAEGVTWLRIRHEKTGLGWVSSEYVSY